MPLPAYATSLISVTVIVICLIVLIIIIVYLWMNKKGIGCRLQNMDSTCSYFNEKYLDSSLKTPTVTLEIASFTAEAGVVIKWNIGTYFAIRYVNKNTGAYSKLGPWSSLIVAQPSVCNQTRLIIGVKTQLDYDPYDPSSQNRDIYPQIHVQYSVYDQTTKKWSPVIPENEGVPVTIMLPSIPPWFMSSMPIPNISTITTMSYCVPTSK